MKFLLEKRKEWLEDRAKKYGGDISKVNLKEVYESQFEDK